MTEEDCFGDTNELYLTFHEVGSPHPQENQKVGR